MCFAGGGARFIKKTSERDLGPDGVSLLNNAGVGGGAALGGRDVFTTRFIWVCAEFFSRFMY